MKKLQGFNQNHDYPLCKNANFAFFSNPRLYRREGLVFLPERHQILFLAVFCIKRNVNNISNFCPKPWTNPFGKMPILWVFETDVFVVDKGLFATWNVENRFFTIYVHDLWHGNTEAYKGLHGVTGGYKGWQGVTRSYRGWQGVTWGYNGL